jgi:hypothetical protein
MVYNRAGGAMKTIGRLSPYLIIVLAVVGLLGWARIEQRRAEEVQYGGIEVHEPIWSDYLPAVRQEALQQPTEEAKLRTLADRLTHHYRELDTPLRFKVIATDDGALALRLNVAAALPRWYTARAARLGYDEATRALGREVPVYIYETYIVGKARLIGICRARNGIVEVALR